MLRFNNGLTSAGLVLDEAKYPLELSRDTSTEWDQWLKCFPSVAAMFATAELAPSPGKLIRTARLQRRWSQFAGDDWALLPHTAGFIDPLHSTGIAHSLCGVELLVQIIEQAWRSEALAGELRRFDQTIQQELDIIDELVAICFSTFSQFELLVIASMLYFALATTYERLRYNNQTPLAFLCADRPEIRELLQIAGQILREAASIDTPAAVAQVRRDITALIAPINHVGLLDLSQANMYRHTVARSKMWASVDQ